MLFCSSPSVPASQLGGKQHNTTKREHLSNWPLFHYLGVLTMVGELQCFVRTIHPPKEIGRGHGGPTSYPVIIKQLSSASIQFRVAITYSIFIICICGYKAIYGRLSASLCLMSSIFFCSQSATRSWYHSL
jgi:hypothetical protein